MPLTFQVAIFTPEKINTVALRQAGGLTTITLTVCYISKDVRDCQHSTRMSDMQKITPFLWFDNNAEEAANFYVSVFKNSKILNVSRYGDAGPGPKGSVMVVSFQLEGQQFTALNGGPQFKFSEAFSFVVNCETQKEIDEYWNKLTSGGGKESACGWLKDKFGFSWQIVPTALGKLMSGDPKKANRVMQALLQMKKLDIATLEEAAEGKVPVSR
jgi:predicted 3-demethylubiquinone-9 3-methyltransferase (glyoxalase superfamily)